MQPFRMPPDAFAGNRAIGIATSPFRTIAAYRTFDDPGPDPSAPSARQLALNHGWAWWTEADIMSAMDALVNR